MNRLLALAVGFLSLPCAAVELSGHARLWLGPGFDSNARRDFVSAAAGQSQPDGFAFALLQLDGALLHDRLRFQGAYDAAGRKFLFLPSEDTIVQSAQLEAGVLLAEPVEVAALARVRDRRGAERDYSDLFYGLTVELRPAPDWRVVVTGGAHRFLFYNRFEYSWWAPDVSASVRYRFLRRHSVTVAGSLAPRTYDDPTPTPPPGGPAPDGPRRDLTWSASVQWAYRGPFHVSAGYAYLAQSSTAYGESILRHRLTVTAGARLPLDITGLLSGTLQLSRFPDGVFLSPELQVVEDDENSSSVTVKLVRPVGKYVELDVRYAFLVNTLPRNQFLYLRHVVSVGVALAF